jgi:hypothetical protein
MKFEYKTYKKPIQNELVSTFTIDCMAEEHLRLAENNEKYIEEMLVRNLANELSKKLTFYSYKKSKTTGKIYDGFYNYTPASDPLCDTVYEARFELFSESLERIEQLEKRIAEQNEIISSLNRQIYEIIKK